jgi:solute:Na+ symporter, SSS family
MTTLVLAMLGLLVAYAVHLAVLCSRKGSSPEDHLDAGRRLPGWAYAFAATGVTLSAFEPFDHFRLLAAYGYQYNETVLGLILVALCATVFQKRIWLASRIVGRRTLGDLLGAYYGSPAIRLYLLFLLFLFSVPFAGHFLGQAGDLLQTASRGAIPRLLAVGGLAVFLFIFSAIGGWRAVVFVVAGLSVLTVLLMMLLAGVSATAFPVVAAIHGGIPAAKGMLMDAIPGVVQFTRGIGKEVPAGGIWTTTAGLSFALAAAGMVMSPGFGFLGITTRSGRSFAASQVWMTAGIAAGAFLLLGPVFGAAMAEAASAAGTGGFAAFIDRLGAFDLFAAACFVVMIAASLILAVSFLAASGASILTLEFLSPYLIPGLGGGGRRLAARVALAGIYAAAALLAGFAPAGTAAASSVTLSLAAQLLPALLGLCWLPWISRSAVLSGLIAGIILVVFTEPPGLILFEGLFVPLPWGRWPLTIHSAAWGLFFNLAACLIVTLFTKSGEERAQRDMLHTVFRRDHRLDLGGRAARGAKWSLPLLWTFLTLGPGAILGNSFFSRPMFAPGQVSLGLPSLWVWQLVLWVPGLLIVWWLAYFSRMAVIDREVAREGELRPPAPTLGRPGAPPWLELLVTRLSGRQRVRAMQGERSDRAAR